MESRLEEMIRRFLERSQHERAVLQFGYAEPGNAKNFAFERHDIAKQHCMPRIDSQTV